MIKLHTVFKFFMFGVALTVVCVGCAKQTRQQSLTIEPGVLNVGVEVGYPPMEYLAADGHTLAGFDIDLTKAVAERLGLKIQYTDAAWEGILAGLDTHRYDVAINITILPERQQRYNFTKPYIDSSIAIVTRKGASVIETPAALAGQSVCYQTDTSAQYFVERLQAQGIRCTAFSYDSILNCFADVRLGRVDFVVSDNIVALAYAGKPDSPYEVLWQGPADEYIGMCLKKGNDALTTALDAALDELFADGTLARIAEETFGRDVVSALRH